MAFSHTQGADQRAAANTSVKVLHKRLSKYAAKLLEPPEMAVDSRHAVATMWKGEGAIIAKVLVIHVSHAPEPLTLLAQLANEVLSSVPSKVASKKTLEPCGGYGALSSASLTCWYR